MVLREQDQRPYADHVQSEDNRPMLVYGLLASLVNLNRPGHYIHWGFIQLSLANLIVIILMVIVFVLAIVLPFPRRKGDDR
jgi:hypothetical protein